MERLVAISWGSYEEPALFGECAGYLRHQGWEAATHDQVILFEDKDDAVLDVDGWLDEDHASNFIEITLRRRPGSMGASDRPILRLVVDQVLTQHYPELIWGKPLVRHETSRTN